MQTLIAKKYFITALFFLFSISISNAEAKESKNKSSETAQKVQVVEASCGQCNFTMKEKGCTLTVRIDGKTYFVDGTYIDSHGNSHDDDGFCNVIRKEKVKVK